jgi:hypothetical protein
MPQKTWAVGEEVLASDFNTYVQNQTVPQFPNIAARATWTAPPDGAMCVTTDDNLVWQYNGAAWVAFPSVPHTKVSNTAPGGATSSTSNVTVAGVSVASFVKYRADSQLLIHCSGAFFIDDALSTATVAIDVAGGDHDIASASTGGTANADIAFAGTLALTGIAAGTISSIFAQVRVNATSVVATVAGRWSLVVTETM